MNNDYSGGLPSYMIPTDVAESVERYVRMVDHTLRGRLEGLYLVGSIALGDFKPNGSDVDLVAVMPSALGAGELDSLADLHRVMGREAPRSPMEGIYVTWQDLQRNPNELGDVPYFREGELEHRGGFDANPAVWLTLRKHPLAIRGPVIPKIWHDERETRRWVHGNLNSYWASLLAQLEDKSDAELAALSDEVVTWCVPGVARLHFTIATGDVTSKSGACRYALDRFPARWHPLLTDALALRAAAAPARSRLAQARDARDFMRAVIDNANALMASLES